MSTDNQINTHFENERLANPFSENLAILMEERKLSGRAIAELCGVSNSTVSEWLKGAMPQNFFAIQKLTVALGCSFEWLLTGEDL